MAKEATAAKSNEYAEKLDKLNRQRRRLVEAEADAAAADEKIKELKEQLAELKDKIKEAESDRDSALRKVCQLVRDPDREYHSQKSLPMDGGASHEDIGPDPAPQPSLPVAREQGESGMSQESNTGDDGSGELRDDDNTATTGESSEAQDDESGDTVDVELSTISGTVNDKKAKIAKGWLTKLAGENVTMSSQYRAGRANGSIVAGSISGIGKTAIDKIDAILSAYESEHSVSLSPATIPMDSAQPPSDVSDGVPASSASEDGTYDPKVVETVIIPFRKLTKHEITLHVVKDGDGWKCAVASGKASYDGAGVSDIEETLNNTMDASATRREAIASKLTEVRDYWHARAVDGDKRRAEALNDVDSALKSIESADE